MDVKVHLFNILPRPEKAPTDDSVPNHWVFGVCHLDIPPSADIVLAVNPHIRNYLLRAGSGQIISLPTTREIAEATIPHLLDAFLEPTEGIPAFAPWTWSTLGPNMAQAIEDALRSLGVRPELCNVGPNTVRPGDVTKCHGCGLSRECFFQPLQPCGRCGTAFYHSRECQEKHLEHHEHACLAPGSTLDADTYYNTMAPFDPEAWALMSSLRLEWHPNRSLIACASEPPPPPPPPGPPPPRDSDSFSSLPLHRLIITGQDTPENMRLLFGPQYESTLKEPYEKFRIGLLLDPPPGSPWHAMDADLGMDDPFLVRSLRPATEAEKQKVEEVREMQALIRQRVDTGKSPSLADMHAILTMAVNTMDQGVPAGGFGESPVDWC
ncbi:uncharacterized protein B0T15DRAFT_391441 [Chaetomium strumarium]|uniref:MYND-type domain-containing protein n=1 Tax=Chaetomium strumarium TaxID=1170767 RepID=A0AAJ0M4Z4_9PEZI|nr:hypothetical protein B0T15DRAFT_391441 [Chaetomium strumarium]